MASIEPPRLTPSSPRLRILAEGTIRPARQAIIYAPPTSTAAAAEMGIGVRSSPATRRRRVRLPVPGGSDITPAE